MYSAIAIEQFNGGECQLPLANKENLTTAEAGADVPTAGGDDRGPFRPSDGACPGERRQR